MKKVISLVLAIIMIVAIVPIYAEEAPLQYDKFIYTKEGDRNVIVDVEIPEKKPFTVSNYENEWAGRWEVELKVPYMGDGLVFELGKEAFRGEERVGKLIIGEGFTTIPEGLCRDMPNLEEVVLPQSVKQIGDYAFSGCAKLRTINLDGVQSIGMNAFEGTCVLVEEKEETVGLNFVTYKIKDGKATVEWVNRDLEGIVIIPDNVNGIPVTQIGNYAFTDCKYITEIILPDSIEWIYGVAFRNCSCLEKINIPCKAISAPIFQNCQKLKEVVLGEELSYLHHGSFSNCKIEKLIIKNQSITISRKINEKRPEPPIGAFVDTEIGVICAYEGSDAEKYAIEEGIEFKPLEEYDAIATFIMEETEDTVIITGYKDPATTELYVPGEINGKRVVLGEGAFEWTIDPDNRALEKVTIAEGITSLPKECFYFSSVKEVNLPYSLTEIGERAFSNSDITAIDIKNVTKLGEAAFDACDNLTTVMHLGKLVSIGRDAFMGCSKLKYIDLTTVKTLGMRAFSGCSRLNSVKLQSLESWEGINDSQIDNDGRCHVKQMKHSHGGQSYYIGLNAYVYAPFFACSGLTDVTVRYPDAKAGEKFPVLFLNCNNINKFTIENYQDAVSRWECSHLSFDNTVGDIYFNKRPHDMTVYCSNIEAEAFAENNGWEFVLLDDGRVEVEPKIQGVYGGVLLRQYFTERIIQMAESMGAAAVVSGDSIVVQKDGKSLLIANDTVYYMENGTMVTESLYYDYDPGFLKIPEKALESVLGEDPRKSEEYKEVFRSFNETILRLVGTIETPYGTVAERCTGGVMHGFANELTFVKWDGETINLTKDAPYYNVWSNARWKKIELSEDGKMLTITYPGNKRKASFFFSDISPERVLWDEGTYVITANLETGEVKRVIIPLKEEKVEEKIEVKEPEEDATEYVSIIEKHGIKNISVSILSEPQNGPLNMFDENYVSYCVLYVKDEESPEYMEFDLGEVKNVKQLALAFRDATSRTTYFDVRVSEDGENFETVIEKRGSNGDTNNLQYFDINKNARYVRVYGYSNTFNKYWVSITEARVSTE